MTCLPTRLILSAAVAAVGLGAGYSSLAQDGQNAAKNSCCESQPATLLISADSQDAQSAPAEEMLAKFKEAEIPRPDMSKTEDPEYMKEFREKRTEALKQKAALGRGFVMAHPDHLEAAKVFEEITPMRLYMLQEQEQVLEDIETLLASEKASGELKKNLEIAKVEVPMMTGGGDLNAAWEAVQELNRKYHGDDKIAGLMAQVAERSKGEERIARLQQTLETFPDSKALKYTRGKLRQAEGVGKPFEISFTDAVTGEEVTSEDLKGKVVVIDFWATWCGPCIAEMPMMKELYSQYNGKGVEFIGISLDAPESEQGKEKLLAYVKENDVTWPQYYQGNGWESEFSSSWGINGIPAIFILDAEGNLHSTEARGKLETLIPELIAKRDGGAAKTAGADVE